MEEATEKLKKGGKEHELLFVYGAFSHQVYIALN